MDYPKPLQDIADGTKYPIDAFHFVRRGLDYTVQHAHENAAMMSETERHVSGRQLCEGLRDYALMQYGQLTQTMLRRWGIIDSMDFGEIVFAMVRGGLMQATEHDSIDDFRDVFRFDELTTHVPVEAVVFEESEISSQQYD